MEIKYAFQYSTEDHTSSSSASEEDIITGAPDVQKLYAVINSDVLTKEPNYLDRFVSKTL